MFITPSTSTSTSESTIGCMTDMVATACARATSQRLVRCWARVGLTRSSLGGRRVCVVDDDDDRKDLVFTFCFEGAAAVVQCHCANGPLHSPYKYKVLCRVAYVAE